MPELLLIEPSATLRRVLAKQLQQHHHAPEAAEDFLAGLSALSRASERPAAVVLGWPAYASEAGRELLARLRDGPNAKLPLVLIAHRTEPEAADWARARANTVALTWDEFGRLPAELKRLISEPNDGTRIITSRVRERDDSVRVLLVDDSHTIRYGYQRLLERHGYRVHVASNGAEAMRLARREPVDIAIIDFFLDNTRGDALARELREDPATAHIASAILTGTYQDAVVCDALAAGAVECMLKNEAEELFLARVAALSRNVRITRKVERERQRLAGILGSVGDGVFGVDRMGVVTFINPAALRLLGLSPEQSLVGQPGAVLFGERDAQGNARDTRFLKAAYEDGVALNAVETRFRHRTGSLLPVECTIYPLRIDECLEGSVIAFRDISERKLLEEELKWQINHDSLTKLFNRKYFEEAVEHEVRRLKRSHERSGLLLIDLDHFNELNDAAGQAAGDALLTDVAQRLRNRLREADVLARLGGDEFALLLRNLVKEDLLDVAEAFRGLLAEYTFRYGGRTYELSASIGATLLTEEVESPGEAFGNAGIACHIAKSKGRNQCHVYEPVRDRQAAVDLDAGWSTRLHQALEDGSFVLEYQPIVALVDVDPDKLPEEPGALWGELVEGGLRSAPLFETLVRLPDTRGEYIRPDAFLPTAERFNLMRSIDRWVIGRALESLARLHRRGHEGVFTINLSGQSMDDEQLVPFIQSAVEDLSLDASAIVFEVTETQAIGHLDRALSLMGRLQELGCRFALDDFGSGYSSFPHLKHLPVDFLKIDGSFVQGIGSDPMDRAIVGAINDIAHSLGKLTIAEAVERAEDVRLLKACGVDYIQGHYLAEPAAEPMRRPAPAAHRLPAG